MVKTGCTIDSLNLEYNKIFQVEVRGWTDCNNHLSIELYGDKVLLKEMEYNKVEREDVQQVHPEVPLECGFELKYKLGNMKFENLHLFIRKDNEKVLLQSISLQELFKDMQTIHYNIDSVRLENKLAIISGWAFSTMGDPIEISLKGVSEYTVKPVSRGDVKLAFEQIKGLDENKIGFEILFDSKNTNNIKVEIRDHYNQEIKDYSLKDIRKGNSKIRKLTKYISIVNTKKAIRIIQKEGFKGFYNKVNSLYLKEEKDIIDYNVWLSLHLPSSKELEKQRNTQFEYNPLISIVVPTYNTPKHFLIEMIESVREQTYPNWELCLADGSDSEITKEILKEYALKDKKIKVGFLDENKGISDNTNAAIDLAQGDYIALFDHDDLLTPNALYEYVKVINTDPDVDFIYCDEDKTDEEQTEYFEPHFKPDWSPDTLRSYNYICHLSVFKKTLLDQVGRFNRQYDGSQDHDMILRLTEKANKIVHIPKILYHWRVHKNSTAGGLSVKEYTIEAGRQAIASHITRMGMDGEVTKGLFVGSHRVTYELKVNPLVSIIIPNKDHKDTLKQCIDSIIEKTTYSNYEIIIVENNSITEGIFDYYDALKQISNINITYWEGDFNYPAINNYGAQHAKGEVLLLLNNDVEIISPNWIEEMLMLVQREDVGIVGARLYYPDNTVQHAGVVVGMLGVAGHVHKGKHRLDPSYFGRAQVVQNLSAVTAACLMIKKSTFEQVEGLDEEFKVAFNDVDLCLRVRELGKLVVYTPFAELYHYESKSRGAEDTFEKIDRFNNEIKIFKERWGLYRDDPYYNVNLTLDAEDFSLRAYKRNYV